MSSTMPEGYAYIDAIVGQFLLCSTPIFYMAIAQDEILQPLSAETDSLPERSVTSFPVEERWRLGVVNMRGCVDVKYISLPIPL